MAPDRATADGRQSPATRSARLAEAAGYDDPERWWEDMVEHRVGEEPWDAITEAMAELRAQPRAAAAAPTLELEAQREASMRQHIRAAEKRHDRVAVVCGAWHAPCSSSGGRPSRTRRCWPGCPGTGRRDLGAVDQHPPRLRQRLRRRGNLPGLVRAPLRQPGPADRAVDGQGGGPAAGRAARRLPGLGRRSGPAGRGAGHHAGPAPGRAGGVHRRGPGSVSAGGYDTALTLIGRRLVVGDVIGEVPPETPTVPLAADLAARQRRLRLRPEAAPVALELDLRKDTDLGRSHLLHRLNLLGVPWGVVTAQQRGTGTFREEWSLRLGAGAVRPGHRGQPLRDHRRSGGHGPGGRGRRHAADVAGVTSLVEQCLLAELPGALAAVMAALDERSALSTDVGELMDAVSPLARVLRYGTVRRTEVAAFDRVVQGLVARLCVSLGPAWPPSTTTAASAMTRRISAVTAALAPSTTSHCAASGWPPSPPSAPRPLCTGCRPGGRRRIVFDAGLITAGNVARRLSAALSRGEDPAHGAAWIEGLLAGSGLLLVHDRACSRSSTTGSAGSAATIFDDVLPLLRRSFACSSRASGA